MNQATENKQPPDTRPGALLRQARLAAARTLDDVAHEMHMNVWQIEALEKDQYERLSSSVFIQGYIRAYARLLGIDAEPLLKKFRTVQPDEQRWETHPPVEVSSGDRGAWMTVLTGLVAAALVAVFVVWLNANGYLGSSVPGETSGLAEAASDAEEDLAQNPDTAETLMSGALVQSTLAESGPAAPPSSDILPPAAGASSGGVSAIGMADPAAATTLPAGANDNQGGALVLDGENAASLSVPQPDLAPSVTVQATPLAGVAAVAVDQDAASADAATASIGPVTEKREVIGASAGAGAATVLLSFDADSWVEIRDASDKLLLHGLRQAGFVSEVRGRPPFQVFLGNASGVSITIDGKSFDLTSYVRANRTARFLLLQRD